MMTPKHRQIGEAQRGAAQAPGHQPALTLPPGVPTLNTLSAELNPNQRPEDTAGRKVKTVHSQNFLPLNSQASEMFS